MEFVFLSGYIPLRDLVKSGRMINKEYYRLSDIFFRLLKKTIKTKNGKDLSCHHRYTIDRCDKCEKLSRCRKDPFGHYSGMHCIYCQSDVMCLTKVRKYLDGDVIKSMDRMYIGTGTYYLKEDVEAYDFIFDGPNDRRMFREIKSDGQITKRFQTIDNIYTNLGIFENRNEFNGCRYINAFIQRGKYGIRAIKSLISQCHVKAKEVYDEIERLNRHTRLNMSLGTVLSWAVVISFNERPKFSVQSNRIETEKQVFFDLIRRMEVADFQRQERKTSLMLAFERHDISTSKIDHYPYVWFGEPSLYETCKQMHFIKWLHESTPFCTMVENNKRTRGYSQDYIKPDPYYKMIYPVCVEAKTMVLSLGYTCPSFVFNPI